ncbi:MAG TPA: hypothetical protein H9827_03720 [Candidatus Luteimonas excrementigallinarum]|nr:hypothetical protein [Candidatus Luteimonas excrementigallinarum]
MARWLAVVAMACFLLAAASCGTAAREAGMQAIVGLDGDGPWQRFIIKYRPESAAGRDPEAARATLEAAGYPAAVGAERFPRLQWQRRLGVGADLFTTAEPLDRDGAQRLLQALARDPDVQYVEAETMMQALPAGPQRPR